MSPFIAEQAEDEPRNHRPDEPSVDRYQEMATKEDDIRDEDVKMKFRMPEM